MNKQGQWRLSPAFDVAYSYNPNGAWTSRHQMSLAGRRDDFSHEDLIAFAQTAGLKKTRARTLLREVAGAVGNWQHHAAQAAVAQRDVQRIQKTFRMELAG